jgi:hypothetical protein
MSGSGQFLIRALSLWFGRDEVPLYQNALTSAAAVKDGRFELVVRETGDYFLLATGRERQGLRQGRRQFG